MTFGCILSAQIPGLSSGIRNLCKLVNPCLVTNYGSPSSLVSCRTYPETLFAFYLFRYTHGGHSGVFHSQTNRDKPHWPRCLTPNGVAFRDLALTDFSSSLAV